MISFYSQHIHWTDWEDWIDAHGITIDRPHGSTHPEFVDIIYPMDYGYVNRTLGSDGNELDIFVGSAPNGLVGLILTHDYRKHDREAKLLYNCKPEEVYLANGFLNFDPELMDGRLVMRRPMQELWT